MPTALVTAIGSFSADIVIPRMKELGYRVVGCDIYARELVVNALYVDSFHQAPYATKPEEYEPFIVSVCASEQVDVIIPLTDIEVDFFRKASQDRDFHGTRVYIPKDSCLDIIRDKDRMAKFLETSESGAKIIPTQMLVDVDRSTLTPPLVFKRKNGRSSEGLIRAYNERELAGALEIIDDDSYIVQPLIDGAVITVDVIRSEAGGVACIPRKELLRTLNGAGTSVYVFTDDELTRQCTTLANELGIEGCVNMEFIEDSEGTYWFLECNSRFAGGVQFSCIAAYDCVENHLRAHQHLPLLPLEPYDSCYIARRYEEYVTKVEKADGAA